MASRLLVVGNDKIGRGLLAHVKNVNNLAVAVDTSTDWRRVIRLIRRGQLRIQWVMKMAWAEFLRPPAPASNAPSVATNRDLQGFIDAGVRQVFLFRAGLIVNPAVIALGAEIVNVHCASLPEYGGVGAILRALRDGAYDQAATLHRVTSRIDEGPVLATQPYRLDPLDRYAVNEDRAYAAGAALLISRLQAR